MKTLWFGLTHDDEKIDKGVLTFAIATGWQAKIPSDAIREEGELETMIDNPVSAVDWGGQKLWEYIAQTVTAYNANKGQEAGRQKAIKATSDSFVGIIHETTIEPTI